MLICGPVICPDRRGPKNWLEDVLQAELEDSPRNRARGDHPIVGSVASVAGLIELRVIPNVKELRPELKIGVFPYSSDSRILDDRQIPVKLRAAIQDSDTGVAETRAAPNELWVGSRAVTCKRSRASARNPAKLGQ